MITNKDRSGWFGASDTPMLFAGHDTDTFRIWWLVKLGVISNDFSNRYMDVGNILEIPVIHKIQSITGEKIKLGKRPVYIRKLRLRVNLDGYTLDKVVEIKTTKTMFQKVPINYWWQCQAAMFATGKHKCDLWAYECSESDYECPYLAEIDESRLRRFEIVYDPDWVQSEYLPRLRHHAKCLKERKYPA